MSAGHRTELGSAETPGTPRWVWLTALLLVAVHTFLVVRLMLVVDQTVDEPAYLNSGRAVVQGDWSHEPTRLHGPIPYYLNQLCIGEFPEGGYWQAPDRRALLFRSRLGMLPFTWLAAAVVFLWSRRLFGSTGGLVSLALYALNPLMLGYASLVAVDVAHASLVLAALFAAWCFTRSPGEGLHTHLRAAGVGACLGLAFATKYLALFNGPIVVLAVALAAGSRPKRADGVRVPRAIGRAAGAAVVCVLATFLTLHAAYGFQVPTAPGDPSAYRSALISGLIDAPGIGAFLQAFPEPYLVGLDYQGSIGEQPHMRPYLNGSFAEVHHGYYVWSFLLKSPDWLVVATVGLVLGWWWKRLAGRGRPGEPAAAWIGFLSIAVSWVYLSTSTGLQIGIRYVIPTFPVLFVLLGAYARWRPLVRAPRPALAAGLAALFLWNAWDLAAQWPDLLSYYNRFAGGPAEGWRHFLDSNSNWGHREAEGLEELRATESEPFQVLTLASGPRLGRVVVNVRDLARPDTEDEGRMRHWLEAVEPPVRHIGATWYLFDVDAERWRAYLETDDDPRRRQELAMALLGAGRVDEAREVAAPLPAELRGTFDALDARTRIDPGSTGEEILAAVRAWSNIAQRHDLAVELLASRPELARANPLLMALTQLKEGKPDDAIETLKAAPLKEEPRLPRLLAQAYLHQDRRREAVAVLEQAHEDFPDDETILERLNFARAHHAKKEAFLASLTDG